MTLEDGVHLRPHIIVAPLGTGPMSELYRTRNTWLDCDAEVQVRPETFARHPERVVLVQREAKVLGLVSHANIAPIYPLETVGRTSPIARSETGSPTTCSTKPGRC